MEKKNIFQAHENVEMMQDVSQENGNLELISDSAREEIFAESRTREAQKSTTELQRVRQELSEKDDSVDMVHSSFENIATDSSYEASPKEFVVTNVTQKSFFKRFALGAAFIGLFAGAAEAKPKSKVEKPDNKVTSEVKDPFVIRAGRTVGHVSGSFLKNTGKSFFNEVKEIVRTPVEIGEVVMGRDFRKHEDITPKERLKKVVGVITNAGSVAAGVATSGISTASVAVAQSVLGNGTLETVEEYNPEFKKSQEDMKNRLMGESGVPKFDYKKEVIKKENRQKKTLNTSEKKEVQKKARAPRSSAR